MLKYLVFLILFHLNVSALAPGQPTEQGHPGSSSYEYSVYRESLTINNRKVDLFLPKEALEKNQKVPVVVFGHGQAIGVDGYDLTFNHLAQKGVAVIHPMYDSGFFDQDWARMAKDFNNLTNEVFRKFGKLFDLDAVIYSGHSKGGYIALMAAGDMQSKSLAKSLVFFAPAGFDQNYLKNLNKDVPMTLVWGEVDTIIKQKMITDIYQLAPNKTKQWIEVKSYPDMKADHYFPMNKAYVFGGKNGVNSFHYYATWKWLLGAAWDLQQGGKQDNPYLYGIETDSTGLMDLKHIVTKNW